jgi:hypothetical protein
MTKICIRCEIEKCNKDYNKWYKKNGTWGFRTVCRSCESKCNKLYRKENKLTLKANRRKRLGPYKEKTSDEERRKRRLENEKKNRQKFPEKCAARRYLRDQVKNGKIKRPYEDYTKPLYVQWVCKKCHTKIHKIK